MDQQNHHSKETHEPSSQEPLLIHEEEEAEALLNYFYFYENDDELFEEEKRVASVLIELPELIKNRPTASLIGKPPWLVKKKRSALRTLTAPPSSPASHDDPMNQVIEGLMEKLYELIETRNAFTEELGKVLIHQENQKAFGWLLQDTRRAILMQQDNHTSSNILTSGMEIDQNQTLQLKNEPSSSNGVGANENLPTGANENQERLNVGNGKIGANENQERLNVGNGKTSSARIEAKIEAKDQNQESVDGEILRVDQDQKLQSGSEP